VTMSAARAKLIGQALAVGLVAALLGLLVWKVVKDDDKGIAGELDKGRQPAAYVFELPRLDRSGTLSLADYRGKVVVVNWWASWCGPCKEELPDLQRGSVRWQGKDVQFVGVDFNDFRGDARRMLARFSVTYPNVFDRKGSTIGRYGITGVPETFFISRSGKVVSRVPLPISPKTLDENITRALTLQ
jgi:cytochrome c biogenesis protein CcmG/thiol:disulfide interchange protein DsbE